MDPKVLASYQAFCQDILSLDAPGLIERYKGTAFLYLSQEED